MLILAAASTVLYPRFYLSYVTLHSACAHLYSVALEQHAERHVSPWLEIRDRNTRPVLRRMSEPLLLILSAIYSSKSSLGGMLIACLHGSLGDNARGGSRNSSRS